MKFGFRTPSLRKRVAARTSWKRVVRHSLGLKAPRGWGWLTNPKKAAYNRVYSRTTIDPIEVIAKAGRSKSGSGGFGTTIVVVLIVGALWALFAK